MDHLPTPSGNVYPKFEIPCEIPNPYDGGLFREFPTRAGWDLARLLRGDFSEKPTKETSAMLQNWLFFGLLYEFFNGDIRPDEFVRWSDGRKLITTEMLVPRQKKWKSSLLTWGQSACDVWLKNLEECLDVASTVVQLLGIPPHTIPGELLLSFMVLGNSLSYVRKWMILPGQQDSFHLEDGAYVSSWGTSLALVSRLFNSGWCPTDIARLHSMFDVLGMYQASFLRQPKGAVLHKSCTRAVCVEDSIDELEYHKIYKEHNSGTAEGPDITKVAAILQAGGFPLIQLSSQNRSPIIEDIVAYRSSLSYMAISHVWSHGLGNPSANALSSSQLAGLRKHLSALRVQTGSDVADGADNSRGLYLWIDTLCVPLEKETRKIALQRINTAYAHASSVLVLDASLLNISCKIGRAELALRVYSSRWMQRLWTLAEGVLARRLCFQFLDGAITLDELKPAIQLSIDQIFELQLHMQAFRPLMVFRRVRTAPPADRFDTLWNAATYRSTSKVADEPIILATIAGFNEGFMSQVINTAEDKRMETFLSLWDNLPTRILFATGKHLNTPGYGWAVQSLLSRGDLGAYDYSKSGRRIDSVAHRVPRGLLIRQAGYLLNQDAAQLPWRFQVHDKDDADVFTVEQEQKQGLQLSDTVRSDSYLQDSKFRSALILSTPRLLDVGNGQFAALVTLSSEENAKFYCQWYSRVWISKSINAQAQTLRDPSGAHAAFSNTSLEDFNKLKDTQPSLSTDLGSPVFEVKKVDEKQEWCIG